MNKERIKWMMQYALDWLERIDKEVGDSLLQNEQFVLDFYDLINSISIRR